MAITKEQVIDILDKFDFFQGQRAGRELWNDKPYEVQEEDIKTFSRDVAELKAYIADVVPKSEVKEAEAEIERLKHTLDCYALQYGTVMDKYIVIEGARAEVAREIFEEIEQWLGDYNGCRVITYEKFAELKKKYTEVL